MAPRRRLRPAPLDDPPTSSDDDQPLYSKKPEEEQVQPPSKNPPPSTPISNPASKPMKAQAQSTPVPARSGTKRPNENGSKRAKKKTAAASGGGSENEVDGDGGVKMTGEDSKKKNPRLFTEEDEIAILKGLADFISKTGKDPMKDPVEFHSFVKKSIPGKLTSEQLKGKIRKLKTKFKDRGSSTKEHDKKAFKLFKKVWGNTGGNEAEGNENGKVNENTPKSTKKKAPVRNNGSAQKEVVDKKGSGADKSLALSEMCLFGEAAGLSKDAIRRGMDLMAESKVEEFDQGWRKVLIVEMELFVTGAKLLKDQVSILLDAVKKDASS